MTIEANTPALSWRDGTLLRRGAPGRILAGSLHYFRVHPAQWRDRLIRLADLGLDTVDTYVPWNFHQPQEHVTPTFDGWRNVESFLELAAEVGLDAIVRPGPFICAEWSNGGLPVWLTGRIPGIRTSHPQYMSAVSRWFDDLIPRLARRQAAAGGPVIAVQVENEFGSYGDDASYPAELARMLRSRGITETLYTADGPTELMLDAGAVDGILTSVTLGSKPGPARDLAQKRRADEPFFVAEFWNGWFDHWGQPHHVRSAQSAATTLSEILELGGSVSIYMAHGGTNFGLWAGANRVDGELRTTTTSYDSDAPIAEDGRLTPKFFAIRDVLGAHREIRSADPVMLAARRIAAEPGAGIVSAIDSLAGQTVAAWTTSRFEDLHADCSLVRYDAEVLVPNGPVTIHLPKVADRAQVFLDDDLVATVEGSGDVQVVGSGELVRLTLLVESLGRVNYGPSLGEPKGLLGPVSVERRIVQRWNAAPVDLDGANLGGIPHAPDDDRRGGGVSWARFRLDAPGDTHLALPGFERGFVWVNDFLLGRYSSKGPQMTLYVPAPLLRTGINVVTILDWERRGDAIELREHAELGPEEEYIEEF